MPDYRDRLRERLAAEGIVPSAHAEAIDEIAEHLSDLHRAAERERQDARRKPTRSSKPSSRAWVRCAIAVAERAQSDNALVRPKVTTGEAASPPISRHALAGRPSQSQLLRDRHPHARDRHRRLHRGLQHRQRAAAWIAAISESRAADAACGRPKASNRDGSIHRRAAGLRRLEDAKRGASRRWASGNTAPTTSPRRRSPSRCRAFARRRACSRRSACPPALGRVFTEEEEAPGHRVVVISDSVWRNHFAAQRFGDRLDDPTQRRSRSK